MATARQLITAALKEVGYSESGGADGHSGNIVKFWPEIGLSRDQGESWCGAFCQAMAKRVGLTVPSLIYTPTAAQFYKDQGRWFRNGTPGDFVFFDWYGTGIDHIGIVVEAHPDGSYTTVEGNTSSGDSGSQRNGGGVYKRLRKSHIAGFGQPMYSLPTPKAEDDMTPEQLDQFSDLVARKAADLVRKDIAVILHGTQDGNHPANLDNIYAAVKK
jgi:cell wall-associated NlpC family hydrolase